MKGMCWQKLTVIFQVPAQFTDAWEQYTGPFECRRFSRRLLSMTDNTPKKLGLKLSLWSNIMSWQLVIHSRRYIFQFESEILQDLIGNKKE